MFIPKYKMTVSLLHECNYVFLSNGEDYRNEGRCRQEGERISESTSLLLSLSLGVASLPPLIPFNLLLAHLFAELVAQFRDLGPAEAGGQLVHLLHEIVAVDNLGALQKTLKLFDQLGKLFFGQKIGLVDFQDGNSHTEQNLGALGEQTVPYAEHRFDGQNLGKNADEPL